VPPLRDQAIVLRHWEYSETSQTASLFTREHGLLRGLAKGSRRDRSTFCGGFEGLTRGEIGASIRPNSELATLTDWDLQEVFWSARRDLLAHLAGMYMVDLLHHTLRPLDPHPALFDRTLGALRAMDNTPGIPATVLRFQWALGEETGFQPRLSENDHDEEPAAGSNGKARLFSPTRGGVVPDAEGGEAWKVRPETLALLKALRNGEPPQSAERAVVLRASRLLGAYWHVVLERELASHEAYAAQVGGQTRPQPVQSAARG